ncbi:hypothetical protein IL306_003539 [Fusarium sp. DS 682]|nr:hypothetical protein IL306_003539 [Fusarium sp. DS 682]
MVAVDFLNPCKLASRSDDVFFHETWELPQAHGRVDERPSDATIACPASFQIVHIGIGKYIAGYLCHKYADAAPDIGERTDLFLECLLRARTPFSRLSYYGRHCCSSLAAQVSVVIVIWVSRSNMGSLLAV